MTILSVDDIKQHICFIDIIVSAPKSNLINHAKQQKILNEILEQFVHAFQF